MEFPTQSLQKRRPIDQQLILENQIIQYAKKSVLSSKIILDEDFEGIIDSPSLNLPPVAKRYSSAMNVVFSAVAAIILKKFNASVYCLPVALMPAGYEIYDLFKRCYSRRQCYENIDKFVEALGRQAEMNRKVIKHFHSRIKAINQLESKVSHTVIEMMLADDEACAKFFAKTLYNVCINLQNQIAIQTSYSGFNYQSIGSWHLASIRDDATYIACISYIERNRELYIYLASNLLSSSVFALESAMWQSHNDFQFVFQTIINIATILNESIKNTEACIIQFFYDFETPAYVPQKFEIEKQSIYKKSMDDCKTRLRIVFDMAKSIETQQPKTRCVFLEEMLAHFEHSTVLVRNLLRYERGIANADKVNDVQVTQPITNDCREKGSVAVVEDENVESDDEMFAYSPHDSDDEFDQGNHKRGGGADELDSAALAIQCLMLQELGDRMKDVRRLKITKTENGDLIVQERPVTLQESGGQIPAPSEQENQPSNEIKDLCSLPPPAPPVLPTNFHHADGDKEQSSIANQAVLCKTLLSSITSVAKQMNHSEDIYDYEGEEYVDSSDSLDENP